MRETFDTRVTPLRMSDDLAQGAFELLDQRLLPGQEVWLRYHDAEGVAGGIRDMVVRGAPAIGIAAAYGVALGLRALPVSQQRAALPALRALLASTRPTAVNLFWALDRMMRVLDATADADLVAVAFAQAEAICVEDRLNNLTMAMHGAALFEPGARILTHCNTGGLATGGYGTALGVIRAVHAQGKLGQVWVDETRPYLQGARLTAWECQQDNLPATLITDNMAAHLMQRGEVDAVIVGADRVANNGDTANKIGTYGLAVLCAYHKLPFYVAAPWSTLDLSMASGASIPIEQRGAQEVTHLSGVAIAPAGFEAAHPAFDMTPGGLITALITERGVHRGPYSLDQLG